MRRYSHTLKRKSVLFIFQVAFSQHGQNFMEAAIFDFDVESQFF